MSIIKYIMKKIILTIGVVIKIYIIFMFAGVIFLFVLFSGAENEEQERIRNFYQEAKFKGRVDDVDSRLHGLSFDHSYRYKEIVDGEKIEVFFLIKSYSEAERFDTQDELAEMYWSSMVEPLFKTSFERSNYFQEITQQINTALNQVGLKSSAIEVDHNYISSPYHDVIVSELKNDLKNKENEPLRGILHLDSEKYLKLGLYRFDIILEEKIPDSIIKQIDVTKFPDANYSISIKEGNYDKTVRYVDIIVKNSKIIKIQKYQKD